MAGLFVDIYDSSMILLLLFYFDWFEVESIYILCEVVAEFWAPVMLYSVGKDSSVLLYLLLKVFVLLRPLPTCQH